MNDPFAPAERAHLKALWDAYFAVTGLPLLTPSPDRLRVLREMDRRGYTAADVRAVVALIKAAMGKRGSAYTEASLEWRNLMARVDIFDEHLATVRFRARTKRRAFGVKRQGSFDTAAPVLTVEDEERMRRDAKEKLRAFREGGLRS